MGTWSPHALPLHICSVDTTHCVDATGCVRCWRGNATQGLVVDLSVHLTQEAHQVNLSDGFPTQPNGILRLGIEIDHDVWYDGDQTEARSSSQSSRHCGV